MVFGHTYNEGRVFYLADMLMQNTLVIITIIGTKAKGSCCHRPHISFWHTTFMTSLVTAWKQIHFWGITSGPSRIMIVLCSCSSIGRACSKRHWSHGFDSQGMHRHKVYMLNLHKMSTKCTNLSISSWLIPFLTLAATSDVCSAPEVCLY